MSKKEDKFFDLDVIHSESDLLVEGRWSHPIEDDFASPISTLGSSTVAILVTCAVSVLSWIMYVKGHSKVLFWHALITSFGAILAIVALVWALKTRSSIAVNRWPNPNLTFLVFYGSVMSMLYYFIAAVFVWVHSSFHLNYMQAAKDRPEDWKTDFWGHDYERARTEDWRIFLAIAVLSLAASVIFGAIAFNVYAFITNTVELKKILLGSSLVAVTIFGFLVIFIHEDYYLVFELIQKHLDRSAVNWGMIAFVFAAAGITLAMLNSITAFLRFRFINLTLGVLWLLKLLGLIVVVAFLFINVHQFSTSKPYSPEEVAYLAHENEYTKFCPSKYVDGIKPSQGVSIYRWEVRPLNPALLNPNCKPVANDVLIWHYYLIAIFTGFLATSCLVAGATNMSLATSQSRYDNYNRFHLSELFTVLLVGTLVFWLGINLLTRDKAEPVRRYTELDSFYVIDASGSLVPNPQFKHLLASATQTLFSKLPF
jgi:hypothetical protein